jgi:hypothetical protein
MLRSILVFETETFLFSFSVLKPGHSNFSKNPQNGTYIKHASKNLRRKRRRMKMHLVRNEILVLLSPHMQRKRNFSQLKV